ncbi:PD-(D/E)XK nuclease family protein [Helicobacter cynogastricus]|uniref:PD-(D/E)XK nuclease family protein n=1 Tax=Helicobacter cynogastricus TaxID=329937 RepID=UPI000CF06E98|nr:PD-(D/E)XK nuclease family protein [Helicobacter cynogastricus]
MLDHAPILHVFSSRRACNAFYAAQEEGFLPTAWSVQEFYNQISYVEGLLKIPESVRRVLLLETIKQVSQEGRALEGLVVFKKSFLGYLDGSDFVARFFNELAKFGIEIAQIPTKDIYGDYQYHLEILERIHTRYRASLQAHGFYDPILGVRPTLMPQVLSKFARIEFYLEGFLSKFEQEMLLEIAQHVPLFIHLTSDRYNQSCLRFLKVDLKEERSYVLDMQALRKEENPIVQEHAQKPFSPDHIRLYGFTQRLDQVGLALQRVQEWLSEGLEPSKLAIITPSAEILSALKLLDLGHNLNFARGENVQEVLAPLFKDLEGLKTTLQTCQTSNPLATLQEHTQALLEKHDTHKLQDFHQEFFETYSTIIPNLQNYSPSDLLELYIRNLQEVRLDHTTGGKIKVLDVLECRGLQFERIVILDFNDRFVPSVQDSDLFLNTFTRTALGIPTLRDKENLQKHYYYQLLKNTAHVDIAYSSAQNALPSKMLADLGLKTPPLGNKEKEFVIFPQARVWGYVQDKIADRIPQDFRFSATKIKDFMACKRRFYLQYLAKFTPAPQESFNMGSLLHAILCAYYSGSHYQNTHAPITLDHFLKTAQSLESYVSLNALQRLELEVVAQKLAPFFAHEAKRLAQARVVACEQRFETSIGGFVFSGIIDRIEQNSAGSYDLLDYKFKSTLKPQEEGYQLAIYAFGAQSLGYTCENADFYDLKKGSLPEKSPFKLQESQEELVKILESCRQVIDFDQTEDRHACTYCAYVDMCGRETLN